MPVEKASQPTRGTIGWARYAAQKQILPINEADLARKTIDFPLPFPYLCKYEGYLVLEKDFFVQGSALLDDIAF